MKCSSFGKFRFRNPSNVSTESILVRVRRMYAVNHGITLRVVTDELSSRGQDRCRHTAEGSQPPKAAGSLSCATEGHDTQKSVTTLGQRTYRRWLAVVYTFFFVQTEFIQYPSVRESKSDLFRRVCAKSRKK